MRALALSAGALAAAALLAACGGGAGLIPSQTASTLHNDLSNIEIAFDTQDCGSAAAYVATARTDFANLSATSVSPRLVTQLQQGLATLALGDQV